MMRAQRTFASACAAVVFASTLSAQSAAVHEPPRYVEAPDRLYGDAVAKARSILHRHSDEFPGLSVAVGVNGRIVWSEGFGWADLEQRVPVRPSSKFRVGSVAKPMTAALLALIYERGDIDLDAPIQRYVPSFPEKEYPITTRQLAGHLGGIRHYQGDEFLIARHYENASDGLSIFADDPLLFEPGTKYSYSTYGWNLISVVIEGATGEPYLPQMQELVFGPLGMRDTAADENRFIIADRVRPYVADDDGRFANAPYVDNSYKWAGGGFVSTAEDLVRFALAHLKPGFLKPSTLELLFTSQRTTSGEETGYGIGWRVGTDKDGRRVIGHGGGSIGGSTDLTAYPDEGVVVALVTNLSNGLPVDAREIAEPFMASAASR